VQADERGERELLAREVAETPEARAVRRALERWITHQRVWVAMDRAGITGDGERARFIASRLWPDLPAAVIDRFAACVADRALAGHPLARPARAEDVVGAHLAALMREHGYPTERG
jgi:hypothetical protein